ncbi:NADH:flavin oxidoreductase [Haladaptatus sp. GCM10025707]|uniref:NADH:flavin oxidoreductase n=1 Tax=unclassified Haladaptatus TaxID=2622732 RepID=UPI0023E7D2A7|nr:MULTISPECIES: NADH:flavin oxidoreductase [unclassified Haladaptatus]
MPTDDTLFDPFDLESLTLDNRVGLAPMTRTSATADGHATPEMARYYAKFARGGFSFLITEGVYTDEAHSQGYHNQPGLATDEQAAAWEPVIEKIHDEDSAVFAQLMHAGSQAQGNRYTDETIAPSAVQPKGEQSPLYGGEGEFPVPTEMTTDHIDAVVAGFAASAERATAAGFDGVEIHSANGYLLNTFLSAEYNEREDGYGGSAENRVRLTREVIEAVQNATPEDFVVGVRLSQAMVSDEEHKWDGGEDDAEVYFRAVSETGADYIHTIDGDATAATFADDGPTLAEAAVEHGDAPVIANGGLGDPASARDVIESGSALITLGTSALANPDWPTKVREGKALDEFDFEKTLLPKATISDHEVPAPADD